MSVLPSEIKYSTDFEILKIHFSYSFVVQYVNYCLSDKRNLKTFLLLLCLFIITSKTFVTVLLICFIYH